MASIPELDEYKPKKDKEPHKPIRSALLKDQIDLGFAPINQTTNKSYELYNPNQYQVSYEIQTSSITIEPSSGVIPPKTKAHVTLSYTPTEALAITEKLIANITEEEPRMIYVSIIGKYPYLSVDEQEINFDSLLVGKQMTKQLRISNCSQVPARFQILQIKDDEFKDNSFNLDAYQGEIPPNDTKIVQVTYIPQVVHLTSVAHYRIACQGGNDVVFECIGSSLGYDAYLNTNSINFGEIKIGEQTSRLLTIHNDSDVPIVFEFFNDQKNIFGFSRRKGRVKPKSYERIIIYFVPKHTICYYERVFGIVRNHTLMYVDLIGTCYDLLIKPLPLLQKHIDAFRRRVIAGKITEIDFRYMENAALMKLSHTMTKSQKIDQSVMMIDDGSQLYNSPGKTNRDNKTINASKLATSSYIPAPAPNQIVLHKELFQQPNSEKKLLHLSEEFLDFNYCDYNQGTVTKELVVTNKMACKITVFWTLQKHEGINMTQQQVFTVYPETASIKPNHPFTFQVIFKPAKSQYYFFQNLQFFAFKYSAKLTKQIIEEAQKAQSKTLNHSVVNALKGTMANTTKLKSEDITADETIPPYSGTIKCVGHSFGAGSQPYIPILEVYPSNKVFFAACSREESLYQTVEIHNTSDTPTYFRFSPDVEKIFSVYPNAGLIQGKSFNVIIIEFTPREFKAYNHTLSCYLNHNLSNQLNFHVSGYCSEPELSLQNSGKIYFPPSYTGVYSRQQVKVQNLSRIQLSYNIEIPEKYKEELYLEPSFGFIKPNETVFLDCSFVPYKKKQYKIKVPLQAKEVLDPNQNLIGYHLPGSGNELNPLKQREAKEVNYNFEIFGAGGDGSLSIEPERMDFDIVKVNFNKKKYATLHNYSNCTFYIELKLRRKNKNADNLEDSSEFQQYQQYQEMSPEETEEYLRKNFTLDFEKGIIAANSKIDVGIMFNPTEVGTHDIVLDVIAKEKNPMAENGETKYTKKLLCQKCSLRIKAKGSYPLLKICDVRNVEVSVATLWENFQINRINDELGSQLNEDEKQFLNIEQLNFTEAAALQRRLKSYDWNFGYLPSKQHVKPRKIVITIQNIGGTECDWQFKLPSDNQIEVEPWADPGEPTEEDAFEKAIIERNIFQIQPKNGTLQPGELQDIILVYSPGNSDENLLFNKKQQQKKSESHFLRVILQIINGKPLCINLRGMTLAPLEGRLAVKKNHYILPDTPIGLLVPVKLPIEIQNVGSSKISYRVEITEMDKEGNVIKSKFDIFSVENSSGSLQPSEKQYLYTQFKPLETKTYYHELKILVYDFVKLIQEAKIKVEGNGYGKHIPKQIKQTKADIPSQRSHVSTIGSKVCFSIEEIDFGKLLPGKAAHRIIILYNLSKTNRLTFDFGGPNISISSDNRLTCGDDFTIEPLSSYLLPGAWCELKLTLIAKETPSVYEGEIECGIVWDNSEQEKDTAMQKQSNLSQPTSALQPDRETLFLRIKKHSSLDVDLINSFKEQKFTEQPDKHCFEAIMENVIHDLINDAKTQKILEKIDQQPQLLYANFDKEDPPSIEQVTEGYEDNYTTPSKNYKDYRQLFLEDEFIDLVDLIMENTYFNVIQETTRGECDLLRISKTFVMPSNR